MCSLIRCLAWNFHTHLCTGGVGGVHLITLVRLGIGNFHLSDPDTFELKNFNRQYGADMSTIGKNKCDVMCEKAQLINPELKTKVFEGGISKDNIDEFLDGGGGQWPSRQLNDNTGKISRWKIKTESREWLGKTEHPLMLSASRSWALVATPACKSEPW